MIDPMTVAWGQPSSQWLAPANLALATTALACSYVVLRSVAGEVRHLVARLAVSDAHAFEVDGLGVTMADGGEEISSRK